MWKILFSVFFFLHISSAVLHQDLSSTRGILVQSKQALCFPDDFWVIRARLLIPGIGDSNLAVIDEFRAWFTQFKLAGSDDPPAITGYSPIAVTAELKHMSINLRDKLMKVL